MIVLPDAPLSCVRLESHEIGPLVRLENRGETPTEGAV